MKKSVFNKRFLPARTGIQAMKDDALIVTDERVHSSNSVSEPKDVTLDEIHDMRTLSASTIPAQEDETLKVSDERVRSSQVIHLPYEEEIVVEENKHFTSQTSDTAPSCNNGNEEKTAPITGSCNTETENHGVSDLNASKNFAYDAAMVALKTHIIFADTTDWSLRIYNDEMGYYKHWTKTTFPLWLRQVFFNSDHEARLSRRTCEDIFDRIIFTPDLQATLNDFAPEQPYLNVLNGVVDVRTGRLLEHSPKYRFINVIHANYLGKDAPFPSRFNKMLHAWFGDDEKARKQFLQVLAYLFSEYYSAKSCIYCVGDSNVGKSALLDFIDLMVGEEVVSHVPLEDFSKEHILPQLYGAKINSYAERDEGGKPLSKTGTFKGISGGDWVLANPKHKNHFKFKARTKCIFMSNRRLQINPRVAENALFNRFLFIDILNAVDEEERIPEFAKVLFNEEADKILTLLVPVLRKWLDKGRKFTMSEGSKRLTEDLKDQRSSVDEFVSACCEFDAHAKTSVKDLKDAYLVFCADNALEALAPFSFIRDLREKNRLSKHRLHNVWFVYGIKLKAI